MQIKNRNSLNNQSQVEKWGRFEIVIQGPQIGNPFVDVRLAAKFEFGHRSIEVDGFYNGNGEYCIRFMPDKVGEWIYRTVSNVPELDSITGTVTVEEPGEGNHGPVSVSNTYHFAYADGTPFYPFGTTSYVWNHQGDQLEKQTLKSLRESGAFNKMRMCIFPKHYDYNLQEPSCYPFQGSPEAGWDFTAFDPEYWRHLEQRINDLQVLGIEIDLILFHPYDRWGFAKMDEATDNLYLQYAVARLSSFRGIWWSLANEYDLMRNKSMSDWDRFFRIIQESDPYQHLRSIHNWHHKMIHRRSDAHWYDHSKPWVTHVSIQHNELAYIDDWKEIYRKPIVIDECRYEGNIDLGWGSLSAERMVECFWQGVAQGAYVTHGETYLHPEGIIWWSHGGTLHGNSPARIRFLKSIMEDGPQLGEVKLNFDWDTAAAGVDEKYYLVYFVDSRPAFRYLPLPDEKEFTIEIIDTWEMKITQLPGTYSGRTRIELPGKLYQALRIKAVL
ncbi:DUF5605 domain-containing protein [Paenibacillus camerounensis]|uniref:DUF5605 domain-containing protein n=1 Tax=Paenibacillus camerounensis TaxID=1243663 RepID=UPI0005A624AF|nr:DUF5605 domain-containing protein [Paenibacillus camerounensis]